jgi:hypothetical protein
MDPLPESQYQDEFYRSVFSATCGNVCLSPEFASAWRAKAAGHIDFFIPIVKWGIEITRDGNHLKAHSSRFANPGAYEAWLKSNIISFWTVAGASRQNNIQVPYKSLLSNSVLISF